MLFVVATPFSVSRIDRQKAADPSPINIFFIERSIKMMNKVKSFLGSSNDEILEEAEGEDSNAHQQQQQQHASDTYFEPLLQEYAADDRVDTLDTTREYRSYHSTARTPDADSNITTERSPVEVSPFWVPPLESALNEYDSNTPYHIITTPKMKKPKHSWLSPRPFVIYDYLLSGLLVYLGVGLIHPSLDEVPLRTLMGAVLFQAGLVAAIMAAYTVFSTCGRRCLRWEDLLIALSIGLSIFLTRTLDKPWTLPLLSKRTTWELFLGAGILEAVLIHLISRGLFLLPNKDDAIIMLAREVASWEESIATGLASQYYADYCYRTGRIVQSHHEDRLAVTYRTDDDRLRTDNMDVPCMFVAVPRSIDWHTSSVTDDSSYVRQKKGLYCQTGLLLPCWIGTPTPEKGANWLCVSGIRQGYVVDAIPKPLQYMIDNIRRNPAYSCNDERSDQYRSEVRRFTQRLAWLAQRDGLGDHIVIIEFDRDVMDHLPSACSEVFRQQHHVTHWGRRVDDERQ